MIEQHLTQCLRQALKERNWSQLDGANAAGISLSALHKILHGKRSPTLDTLDKIMRGWRYPDLFEDLTQ
jgi:transcriptional regulator with XRE-family HTH domain